MTTRNVTPLDGTFSAALKAATWSDHGSAETSRFMDDLMGARLPRDAYAQLVAQQWFVYRELETAAAGMRDSPVAGPFVFDELTRLPALEADLAAFLGGDWAARVSPVPATVAYCDRLAEVAHSWPGGFVAHHYTRYMGDLSGGQFIGRVVRRAYGIDATNGAAFFEFDEVDDPAAFKDEYRRRLDAAPWTAEEQARVIEEIRTAYRLNTDVFADLDGISLR